MQLADLLRETLDTATLECWQRERTATPVRAFAVRLHAAGCSLRETAAILGLLGVERTHGAVWNWVHRLADSVDDPSSATPTRVAVDETAVQINGKQSWVYAAIDLDTKMLLDIAVFGRRGTDPAAAFLHGLTQKHDCSQAVFLVDGFGYLTALSRIGLSGHLEYTDRNLIENGFTPSRCGSIASTNRGSAVGRASANGLSNSCITTTDRGRIKHSMEKRRSRR